VRLLGGVLGRVLVESEGPELLADVERLRQAAIELRTGGERRAQLDRVVGIVAGFDLDRAESVARAFTVYFQLANLAEEHYRARILRERGRRAGPVRESLAAAVAEVRGGAGEATLAALLERLEIRPVLTAHPTEARRRAVVDCLRRIGEQVERLDDPRLPASDAADAHRRLLEETTVLWRTSQLRRRRPSPLGEVRTLLSVFDETLFRLVPELYRELDLALDGEGAGTRAPAFAPFLRWGSWVGGDRDGNPNVTAEVTRATIAVQSEHVLRGLEAVTRRVARALCVSAASTRPSEALLGSLERDEADLPEAAIEIRARAPDEPHRRKLALAAERLVATRTQRPGGTCRRRRSSPIWSWCSGRWWPPARRGWPTGSYSTWCGRCRRSASTWRRWRSASTPRSTPGRSRSWRPKPPATRRRSGGWPGTAGPSRRPCGHPRWSLRCWRPSGQWRRSSEPTARGPATATW
jgi:phosphoenolpyruvate carboxylase